MPAWAEGPGRGGVRLLAPTLTVGYLGALRSKQATTAAEGTVSRTARRDYSLTGPGAAAAVAAGLADATWYSPPIDPERLRVLMERQDWRPARDSALWVVLLVGTAVAAFTSLGHWYEVPAFAVFGALYGGSGDARWHENGACRTAFLGPGGLTMSFTTSLRL